MLKIQALSDIHGDLIDVPKCDVVCICGDFSPLLIQRDYTQMMKWVFSDFISWLIKLNCKKVLIVPGNHDFFFEKMMNKQIYDIIEKGTDNKVKFLIDEEYIYKNVNKKRISALWNKTAAGFLFYCLQSARISLK